MIEVATNVGANESTVNWAMWLEERITSNSTYNANDVGADIGPSWAPGGWWSGGFNVEFRPGGLQSILIASGSNAVAHNADGTGQVTIIGRIAATGTTGAGGPTTISNTIGLTTLTQVPGVPTGVSGTRVSDTQVRVAWANNGASNGQATQNQIQAATPGTSGDGIITVNASSATTIAILPNERKQYHVRAGNAAGWSAWSAWSNDVFTTPGTPSNVTATKDVAMDITVAFTENVSYSAYNHEVWHGTLAGGVTTWDAAALATLGAGTLSYKHTAPDPSKVHVYRVRSKQGSLLSPFVQSNSVQILAAPNRPTVSAMKTAANRAAALTFAWSHNPVDTTPQTAYEFSYSIDGGTTWQTTGKVASDVQQYTFAANAYPANTSITTRVRTWGAATTGGDEGTGASVWSWQRTVVLKTLPVLTITTPANGGSVNDATLRVTLGFTQAEGASFVQADLELLAGSSLVETVSSNNQIGITFNTRVLNGGTYTVRARAQDSNGLWSGWQTSTFTVTYLAPVPAVPVVSYLEDNGWGQITLTLAAPGEGQAEATTVTVTRRIDSGPVEVIVDDYPAAEGLGFLDTTLSIHGTNSYTITTVSALGAETVTTADLVTTELRKAFLSKGPGFAVVGVFGGNLDIDESLSVASTTVEAAGRTKPIGLYGVETNVQLKVKSTVFAGFGSTLDQLRDVLLVPGQALYRDASGRRVFGAAKGGISRTKADRGELTFTLTETSN